MKDCEKRDEIMHMLRNIGYTGGCCRRYLKMTLKDVSFDTGYNLSTIAKYEKGENNNLMLYLYYQRLIEKVKSMGVNLYDIGIPKQWEQDTAEQADEADKS